MYSTGRGTVMHACAVPENVNAIGNAGLNQNPCGSKVETKGDKPDAG